MGAMTEYLLEQTDAEFEYCSGCECDLYSDSEVCRECGEVLCFACWQRHEWSCADAE